MSSSTSSRARASGHPSRRDNHSISSSASGSSRAGRERGDERGSHNPSVVAVESATTRLLVSIKEMLEALTLWSQRRLTEDGVSDVYVRLGNDFNAAVAAFAAHDIDMSELQTVPDDLRAVLESCLAEEASQENLEIFLPKVRQIITQLLQGFAPYVPDLPQLIAHTLEGLRNKQSIYRQQSRTEDTTRTRPDSTRNSRRVASGPRQIAAQYTGEGSEAGSVSSRRSGKRRDPYASEPSQSSGSNGFIGGFAPHVTEQHTGTTDSGSQSAQSTAYSDAGSSSNRERRDTVTLPPPGDPLPPPPFANGYDQAMQPPPSSPPTAPANAKRYSLVDKPLDRSTSTPPPVVPEPPKEPVNLVENGRPTSPPLDAAPIDPPPAVARSLAALKSNDGPLERRASKRFSTYTFSRLSNVAPGASVTRDRSLRSTANHPNRRSLAANTSNLTPNDLAVLAEEGDEEVEAAAGGSGTPTVTAGTTSPSSSRLLSTRAGTPDKRAPPVPPLPATPARSAEPKAAPANDAPKPEPPPSPESKYSVFLQLGKEVKKAIVEPGISFASLRVLFVDKFSYNPGLENFPAIYIRDPSSGVQYELEDTSEVKPNCLLSLNIEPLDQIKQHIDTQIAGIVSEIKELKQSVAASQRQPPFVPDIVTQPLAESTPMAPRPSERQFQTVARRLSRFVTDAHPSFTSAIQNNTTNGGPNPPLPPLPSPIPPQFTGQSLQPQMTGASVLSEYTGRIVTDLKTQFDEVQALRRDIGILRQIYTQFMASTKESLGTLRDQTKSVKQLAGQNVGGARAYIDSGKKKMDTRTQNVLTQIEKLQDTVESIRDDVAKRHVSPSPVVFKNIKKDLDATAAELASISEHVGTVKPMWKKTWEQELQNIVEEQQFLQYQEEIIADLKEDHKALMDVYGHVEKIVTARKSYGNRRGRSFKPVPAEEGTDPVTNVFAEIRSVAGDSTARLEAIERNQRARQEEIATRTDGLQTEIVDFVSQKKLKMTGGAEEAERIRQKRNDMTIKAMFNADPAATFGPVPDSPSTP